LQLINGFKTIIKFCVSFNRYCIFEKEFFDHISTAYTNFECKRGRNGRKSEQLFYECVLELNFAAWPGRIKLVKALYPTTQISYRNLFQEGKGEELAHVDEDEDREPEVEEVRRVPPEHLLGEEHQHGVLNLEAVHSKHAIGQYHSETN
jgi:hypothetical protein